MKIVLSQQAIEMMLKIVQHHNFEAIQINEVDDEVIISAKALVSSSGGYIFNYNFTITKDSNNMGEYVKILCDKEVESKSKLLIKQHLFKDEKKNVVLIAQSFTTPDIALTQAMFAIPNFKDYSFEYVSTLNDNPIQLLTITP